MKIAFKSKIAVILALSFLLVAGAILTLSSLARSADMNTVTYGADDAVFPNPERGWYGFDPLSKPDWPSDTTNWVSNEWMQGYYDQGYRVFKQLIKFPTLTDPLPQDFLDKIDAQLDRVRDNGMKIVIRFNYIWNLTMNTQDAPEHVMVGHLDQLEPLFVKHKDVILFLEVGFLGYWGEMHTSSNGHVIAGTSGLSDSGWRIIDKILEVLPADRMISMRYPKATMSRDPSDSTPWGHMVPYGSKGWAPLTRKTAYDGSALSRMGGWNSGFGGGGLWQNDQEVLDWWSVSSEYTFSEGHCDYYDSESLYGPDWIREAEIFHYATVSSPKTEEYMHEIVTSWEADGTYDELEKRLGYRYYLSETSIQKKVSPGDSLNFRFSVENHGFSRPINARVLYMVLKNATNEYIIELEPPVDFRLWFPGAGKSYDLSADVSLPSDIAPGEYDVYLWLPDPEASIADRPEYAIRIASTMSGASIFDLATGYNDLSQTVTVE